MTLYQQQKNKLFIGVMCLLLAVISFLSFLIYQNQTQKLLNNEKTRLQNETRLLGGFLKDSLLRFDYAEAKNFLNDWKNKKLVISRLIVTLENDQILFEYTEAAPYSMQVKENFKIGEHGFSVEMGYNISDVYEHFEQLKVTLLGNTIIVTSFIGFVLWYLLSHWILQPLSKEITRQTQEIKTYSKFIDNIIDSISSHIAIIDQQGIILRTNKAWAEYAKHNGFQGEPSMHGTTYFQCCGLAKQPALCQKTCSNPYELGVLKVLRGELSEFVGDYDCFTKNRNEWYNIRANPFYWDNEKLVIISHENVTNIKRVQFELEQKSLLLEKINHAFMALSKSNLSLIKSQTQTELFDSVCEIIHNDCFFKLVWIGQPENNTEKSIKIVSASGLSLDYLDNIKLSWSNNDISGGPVGSCIREKQTIIINNTQTNIFFARCKNKAKQYDIGSCASFPIIWNQNVLAVLTVYAQNINAFSQQEIELITELSNNLAFGIKSIEDRQQLKLLSITDQLTQLYNRRYILSSLEAEITRFKRYANPVSIIILDIDYFKQINDKYGHHIGDKILTEFSSILEKCCREIDVIGRWGGEEFLIILPNAASEEAFTLAERIRNKIGKFEFSVVKYKTASFGVSTINNLDTVDTLIERADQALYKAKNQGRNQVVMSEA